MCVEGVGHTPESVAQTSETAASAGHRDGVVAHAQRALGEKSQYVGDLIPQLPGVYRLRLGS